jgi:Spy/CpxP family protein refolding chaperone
LIIKEGNMFKLLTAVLSLSLVFALALPVMAQEESDQAPGMPGMDGMQSQDDDPGMDMGRDSGMGMMMPGMEDTRGMTCSPGCRCEMCMKKRMGVMGMGGMRDGMGMGMGMRDGMGMHGDIDMMTWPKMNKSCRTPDFYIRHKDELGLSDEQVESLRKALVSAKKEAILKGAQVKALELELGEIVTRPDFKLADALAKLKEVEAARFELRSAMLKAASGARDILNPEQLKKLGELNMSRFGGWCDKTGSWCGKAGGYCCKPMVKPMDKGDVPDDMKQKMMEKMQKQMMQ